MRKIIVSLSCLVVSLLAYGQDDPTRPSVVTPLEVSVYNSLDEINYERIIDTLKKPQGYIMELSYEEYLIVIKEKGKWVGMSIDAWGGAVPDSTRRINVNNKGSDELLLCFYHGDGRYNFYGGFSEESYNTYIYNLDNKTLLLHITPYSFYELVNMVFYDSTGESVDPQAMLYRNDELELTEEQLDSLNLEYDKYLESLSSESDAERYVVECTYVLNKNKLSLHCKGEDKAMEEESIFYDDRRVYYLTGDKWVLHEEY